MSPNVMCPGGGVRILDDKQDPGLTWHEAQDTNIFPTGMKRIRLTCKSCGRRIMSALRTCHDGCCLYHVLPSHKIKKWWKYGKKRKKTSKKRIAHRRR